MRMQRVYDDMQEECAAECVCNTVTGCKLCNVRMERIFTPPASGGCPSLERRRHEAAAALALIFNMNFEAPTVALMIVPAKSSFMIIQALCQRTWQQPHYQLRQRHVQPPEVQTSVQA
jgi:hypothetical protein